MLTARNSLQKGEISYLGYERNAVMKYTVAMVGLGSMGKRRIRLLKKYAQAHDARVEIIGVDKQEARREEVEKTLEIKTCASLEQALKNKPDCAFISTSPLSHAELIHNCLSNKLHVFTELNLVNDCYHENVALAERMQLVLFLSSTKLYQDEIEYVIDAVINQTKCSNYIYHVGQYLPDWHPWENYTEYFVGNERTNGCREIMAIELPWIVRAFGDVASLRVLSSKNTDLQIDYPDNYMIQLKHDTGSAGLIAFDVVSRRPVRSLEVYGEHLHLTWDGTPESLYRYQIETKENKQVILYQDVDQQADYANFIVENPYLKEIEAFFDQVEHGVKPRYTFEDDEKILAIIDEIEGKMQ